MSSGDRGKFGAIGAQREKHFHFRHLLIRHGGLELGEVLAVCITAADSRRRLCAQCTRGYMFARR